MEIFSPSPQRNDLIAGGDRERVGELPSRLLQPLRQAEGGETMWLRLPMQSHIQGFNEENSNELSNKFKAIMTYILELCKLCEMCFIVLGELPELLWC